MTQPSRFVEIAIFGSSLVSSYWNGAATYYRGIARALSARGHRVRFFEPDAYGRQSHRDIADPPYAEVIVYAPTIEAATQALEQARSADFVAKASGVGVLDAWLESEVLRLKSDRTQVIFWDVDAPATLDRVQSTEDSFGPLIPDYDLILTYGGGTPVVSAYLRLGAQRCIPIYNALDESTHHPVEPAPRFSGLLGFLGNRMPDREARAQEFFFDVAEALPHERFVLGGSGWDPSTLPHNVQWLGHVGTADHNAFNASMRFVLNVNRASMAQYGFSPPTRVFEAAGAGACLVTDTWAGIEAFLKPGLEVLVADSGERVVEHLKRVSAEEAKKIGERARRRVLSEHTYVHRVMELERALGLTRAPAPKAQPHPPKVTPKAGLDLVFIGLSITSAWGNGHANTYRPLIRELSRLGHRVLFLEYDAPWYRGSRDLPNPPYCRTELYADTSELMQRHRAQIEAADAVILGSYVQDGARIAEWLLQAATGIVAFYDIDTPITLEALAESRATYLEPHLVPRFDLYLSFSGGSALSELEKRWGARRARPLYCSADPESPGCAPVQVTYDLGYLGTYSVDRQPALEELCLRPAAEWPGGQFIVAGAEYPLGVRFPSNVAKLEHVPPIEHASFYRSQRFTLNLTRAAMKKLGHSPSVRLFEAAIHGTPVISDTWAGLAEFFDPGHEILLAESAQEVLSILRETPETERLRIAERARQRVLQRHTARHRALELIEHLGAVERARRSAALTHGARPTHT